MGRDDPRPRVRSEAAPSASRSQHARANGLEQYNANHHRYPDIEAAVAKVEADMNTFIAADTTPSKTVLAASVVTLFAGILLTKHKLLAARGRADRLSNLLELLPNLVGSLQRTLRALGAIGGTDSDASDALPPGGLAEWTERWQARQRTDGGAFEANGEESEVKP